MVDLPRVLVPVPTPYTDDASTLSEVRLGRILRRLREAGVDGFVLCSELGEFTTTSFAERKGMVEITLRDMAGSAVVVNISSLSTAASLDLAQHAKRHGARAVTLMPPYFGDYSAREHFGHVQAIARHGGVSLIIVDPQNKLDVETWAMIHELPNVARARGVAEAVHERLATAKSATSYEFAVETSFCSPLALLFPEVLEGKTPAALEPVRNFISAYGPARVAKEALERLSIEAGPLRAPAMSLPSAIGQELEQLLGA